MAFSGYLNILAATKDEALRNQITVAIAQTATYILNGGSPNNRNHELHAENAIKNPASYIDAFIWPVVADPTVSGAYPLQTDAQVKAVVDAQWPRIWK